MGGAADQVLAAQCRAGSRDALAAVLHRHRPLVCRLARRVAGGLPDLEDVIQDALVAIVGGIGRFRGEAKLSTWVAATTVRTALRHAQRCRQRSRRLADAAEAETQGLALAGEGDDPARVLLAREFRSRLEAALDELSAEHRAVVALRDIEGMRLEEVAQVIGAPIGTVKSRLHHARRALRRAMAPYLEAVDGGEGR